MHINSATGLASSTLQGVLSRRAQPDSATLSAAPTTLSEKISISQAARQRLAAESSATPNATAEFDTDKGPLSLDIDSYFTPPGSQGVDLDSVPLLMPSQKNIDALRQHISAAMPDFLARNGIPVAPASITYDQQGQPQLPADYAYAAEFKQALANEPTMARELSTVNALTSSLVEMNKSIPFQQEYAAASSQAETAAVVAKYSYLFSDHQQHASIALNFTANGELSLTADGKPAA